MIGRDFRVVGGGCGRPSDVLIPVLSSALSDVFMRTSVYGKRPLCDDDDDSGDAIRTHDA